MEENIKISVLISEEEIRKRIREIAAQIEKDYAGREITFVVTLKGAVFFACELAICISSPINLEFVQLSSYHGTKSTGEITVKHSIVDPDRIEGHDILIIEDIIDSGQTMQKLKELVLQQHPASLKVCSLIDKPKCRVVPFEGDYVGFTLNNEFIVGWGCDLDQKYRNLPYIGVISQE